jgi:hypothetical protein
VFITAGPIYYKAGFDKKSSKDLVNVTLCLLSKKNNQDQVAVNRKGHEVRAIEGIGVTGARRAGTRW